MVWDKLRCNFFVRFLGIIWIFQTTAMCSPAFSADVTQTQVTLSIAPYSDNLSNDWLERQKFALLSLFNVDSSFEGIRTLDLKEYPYSLDRMLDLSGMKVEKIVTGYGLYPTLKTYFTHSRQISDADRNYAYRIFRRQKASNNTVSGYLIRNIASVVLEADYLLGNEYTIKSVEISILPVPNVYITAGLETLPAAAAGDH